MCSSLTPFVHARSCYRSSRSFAKIGLDRHWDGDRNWSWCQAINLSSRTSTNQDVLNLGRSSDITRMDGESGNPCLGIGVSFYTRLSKRIPTLARLSTSRSPERVSEALRVSCAPHIRIHTSATRRPCSIVKGTVLPLEVTNSRQDVGCKGSFHLYRRCALNAPCGGTPWFWYVGKGWVETPSKQTVLLHYASSSLSAVSS
jgi:hypothetical protein